MKLKKGVTLVEFFLVLFMCGLVAVALYPRLSYQHITERVQKEMPKTYQYVSSNVKSSNFYTVDILCNKKTRFYIYGNGLRWSLL